MEFYVMMVFLLLIITSILTQKKKQRIFLVLAAAIILILNMVFGTINYNRHVNEERKIIQFIEEPKEIVLSFNKTEYALNDEEKLKFLKVIKQKTVIPHGSRRLRDYNVDVKIVKQNDEIYSFLIFPDSSRVKEFWIASKSDQVDVVKQVRSFWLTEYFKINNFFNHYDIVK